MVFRPYVKAVVSSFVANYSRIDHSAIHQYHLHVPILEQNVRVKSEDENKKHEQNEIDALRLLHVDLPVVGVQGHNPVQADE